MKKIVLLSGLIGLVFCTTAYAKPYSHINTFLWAKWGKAEQSDVEWWGKNYDVILREYTLPDFDPDWERNILQGINPDVVYFASKAEQEANTNYVLRKDWLSQSPINESTLNEIINEAASGKKELLFGECSFWGCYIDKEIMTLLARYYLVKGENVYFGAKNGNQEGESAPADFFTVFQWFDAIAYNTGQPKGSYYEWFTGPDFKIWARDYDKALILVKTKGNCGTTTHSLGGSYYQLHSDARLTGPITEIALEDGKGAVLIKQEEVKVIPPCGLRAVPGDGVVNLSWTPNKEQDIAGYNIYRTTDLDGEGFVKINEALVNGTSYQNTGLTNGQVYLYRVMAQLTDGTESEPFPKTQAQVNLPYCPGWYSRREVILVPTSVFPFVETDGKLEFEAEDSHMAYGSFTTYQEVNIIYMTTPVGYPIEKRNWNSWLDYLIEINNPGDYILIGHIRGDGAGSHISVLSMDQSNVNISNIVDG
ncbi:MAG: fibronectin type III domain-containing protein, partial [bacterium]